MTVSRNKNWMQGDARWNPRQRQRVEEAFRRHVRTPRKNPRGRIQRQPCPFCVRAEIVRLSGEYSRSSAVRIATDDVRACDSQFHHLDYNNPFLGVWCCNSHHRKIEHGTVSIHKRDIWDYSSVVAPLLRVKPSTSSDVLQQLDQEVKT